MKKRYLTLLLCAVFICVGAFLGVDSVYAAEAHWADQYLNNLVELEVMRGDENGELNPDANITRAEFVTMMNRAFGYRDKGKISFKDVPKDEWYYDAICIAKERGYFNGMSNTKAAPDEGLRREEAVAMLCRALKIEEVEFNDLAFSDSKTFSSWSKNYITAMVEKEVMSGYPDETFRPNNFMTRGEMAKVLSTVVGEVVKDEGENYIGYANGNVSMIQTGANLRNTIIPGDLYITAGMGSGYTHLKNVTVNGDLIISGVGNAESGEISVVLEDCDINNLIVNSGSTNIMSIRAEGGSVIENTIVRSNTYLEEANSKGIAFKDVVLDGPAKTALSLAGSFEEVKVCAENNKLSLDKGTIESLTVDEDAVKGSVYIEKDATVYAMFCDTATTVTGTGSIEQVVINANGCNISMRPEYIYIRPGVTATIAGQKMTHLDGELNNAPPEFMDGYPRYQDLQAKSVKLLAKVNKPGVVYWAVKNIDIVNPGMSEEDVINPDKRFVLKSGKVTVVGEKEVTINVSGLQSGVNYEYYMVFVDLRDDRTEVEDESFITVDTIIPKFLNGTPKIESASKDSFTVLGMPSKDVTIYWAVLPNKAVPPTVEGLAELKVSGALGKGEVASCEKNDPVTILMRGELGKELTELTDYDIYLVMRDENDNLSKLYKIKGKTADDTPPEFMSGYPWAEPSDATTLKIRHMESEAGTLYWAVYDFDAQFPPVGGEGIPEGTTEEELKIRAVTTGQRAVKSGKTSVKEKTDALLKISGLAKATPYDVYFVIMDKSGNYSKVEVLKGVKTKDTWPPKAVMAFDKVIEGNPTVDSKIILEFDEIVYFDAEDDLRLIKLEETHKTMRTDKEQEFITKYTSKDRLGNTLTGKEAILNDIISLHDLDSLVKPDYYNYIDFSKATISENNGQTFVTFSPDAFGENHEGLHSGGTYQFELNNLTDADGNAIDVATKVDKFKLVAPQIYVSDYMGQLEIKDNEFAATLVPVDGINTDKLFDVHFISNRDIKVDVEVYVGNATTPSAVARDVRVLKNTGRSVGDVIGDKFTAFAEIKEQLHYKFIIKELDAIKTDKFDSWDGNLTIEMVGVIGDRKSLLNLGNATYQKTNSKEIIQKNKDTLIATNPDFFPMVRDFADTAQPTPIATYPHVEAFDVAANVIMMTDKPATMYYVLIPNESDGDDDVEADEYGKKPTPDELLQGLPQYEDSFVGTLVIGRGMQVYTIEFEGLKPDTQYTLYYVLKGNGIDNLTTMYKDFKTEPLTIPVLVKYNGAYMNQTGKADSETAEMQGMPNTDAKFYWVMKISGLPETEQVRDKEHDVYGKFYGVDQYGHGVPSPYTPEQLVTLADTDSSLVDRGMFETFRDDPFKFICENMDSTTAYDVFATLVSSHGDQVSDCVYVYRGLRSKDNEAPVIVDFSTSIRDMQTVSTGGIDAEGNPIMTNKFDGTVSIMFDEGLYFKNTGGGSGFSALTAGAIFGPSATDNTTEGEVVKNIFMYDGMDELRAEITTSADQNGKVIRGITFKFKGIKDGASIRAIADLYDRNGNQILSAGGKTAKLVLNFTEDEVDSMSSGFTAEFK